MKKTFYKEIAFIIAMYTNSLAISLLVKSVFGVSTLSSLPLVLSKIFNSISFGMMNFGVQSLLLVILVCITRQPKFSYIISFIIAFVFGVLVDLFDVLVAPLTAGLVFRVIYFFSGWVLISFGAALFINSSMPLMPFDGFIKDLSVFLKVSVKKVKSRCDLIFVSSAVILSLCFLKQLVGVGVGTIFMALFTGSLTQYFIDQLQSKYQFVAKTNVGKKLEEIAAIKTK